MALVDSDSRIKQDKQNDDIHTFDGAREMLVLWNKVHGAMLAVRCECEMVPSIDPVEQVVGGRRKKSGNREPRRD